MNGDRDYDARTTKTAARLLLAEATHGGSSVKVDQSVDTPIGAGFGASAAAATSAVYAVASAAGIRLPKRRLALFAHRAEVLEQTGLGTVSVIFDSVGAGAIVAPGEPGRSRFVQVEVPKRTRIVTAYLAPFDKRDALSSPKLSGRISRLGRGALEAFLSDRTLDTLAAEGEKFSRHLGLESLEVKKMISAAKAAGARYASQNMIGYSVHSLADEEDSGKVAGALHALSPSLRVDVFEVGARRAGVLRPSRR